MKTQLYILTLAALCLLSISSYAGNKLPVSTKGEAVYKHAFKLQADVKAEDAYNTAIDWFNSNASVFSCQNIDDPVTGTSKNKTFVEEAFKITEPLQSQDPESGRLAGKGLIKYYGSASTGIGVLYMEYYVVLEVTNHQIIATVSSMKYHHYNQRNYTEKPIFGWTGGKPFDAADNLENLVNHADNNKGVQEVGAFVNKKIAGLLNNLQSYLQSAKMLEQSQPSQAGITEE